MSAQAAGLSPQEGASAATSAYTFQARYSAALWHNASGGIREGSAYLDNLDLTLGVDGERAWGARGLSAFVHVLHNNGARFSARYVGDTMTISKIDAPQALRLYEAWMEWASGSARPLSLRFGLYDLNSEFDTTDSRSLFMHSTHGVGHELAQTGQNGPSIFPNTSLGLRAAWQPAGRLRLIAAVLDGVPGDPDDPTRTRIHLSSEEGALGIAEAQWSAGPFRKLSVSHWRYTARFAEAGSADTVTLPNRHDNNGTYAALEVAFDATDAAAEPRSAAFVRYGVAEGRINEFDRFLGVGAIHRGIVATRPEDEAGLAFSHARVSAATRSAATGSGTPRDAYEAAIELTYRATINDWLTIQPDIQYIFNPGADPALADALAFGLRFEFSATD